MKYRPLLTILFISMSIGIDLAASGAEFILSWDSTLNLLPVASRRFLLPLRPLGQRDLERQSMATLKSVAE